MEYMSPWCRTLAQFYSHPEWGPWGQVALGAVVWVAGGTQGSRREGEVELMLWSKVWAAFAGWEVPLAAAWSCMGCSVKARGAKVNLLSVSPRTSEWPWLVLALCWASACCLLSSLPKPPKAGWRSMSLWMKSITLPISRYWGVLVHCLSM